VVINCCIFVLTVQVSFFVPNFVSHRGIVASRKCVLWVSNKRQLLSTAATKVPFSGIRVTVKLEGLNFVTKDLRLDRLNSDWSGI
jgi:hypothetical protein